MSARLIFRIRPARWLTVALVGLILGLLFAWNYAVGNLSDSSPLSGRILFPPAGARVPAGKVVIIGQESGNLVVVDRSSRTWEFSRNGIGALELELKPGKHVLRIGDTQHEFTVVEVSGGNANETSRGNPGGTGPPSNTTADEEEIIRWHPMKPMAESCEACHRSSDGVIGSLWPKVATPDCCLSCHGSVQLEAIHAHPMEHLHHCQDCHHMHAAPKKHLLTKPIRELCSTCHQS